MQAHAIDVSAHYEEDVKMEMAKRFMAGKMPHLEQVNEPKRKKPKDDIDALHEEL